MAARSESARRVSDCVTALLRDQPFFGSLALRLPIRADETRETLASDGKDIRYAPQWVADTDADHIKTALARVVLACALKHHTRRGGRDPERWQRASQLVTHGLLRDAGFVLPPEAEAWDGISAEQAYDRLPEPSADAEDPGDASSSSDVDDSGSAAGPQCGDGDEDQSDPSNPSGDNSPQEQDEPGSGSGSAGSEPSGQTPASHDPCGTGEVMDADERRDDATGQSGESPLDTPAEEQAWDEAMHQAASLARAQGNAPGAVEETIRQAHRSILDWRSLLRRYMTDAARRDYSWSVPTGASSTAASICPRCTRRASMPSPSSSTPPPRCRARRWPCSGPRSARSPPNCNRTASMSFRSTRCCRTRPSIPPGNYRTASRSRDAAGPISGQASHGSMSKGCVQAAAST